MFMNVWYKQYRNGSGLQHPDWNAFRDPDELVYRTYTMLQDGQETYVFGLFDQFNERGHDQALDPAWARRTCRGSTRRSLPVPHAADGLGLSPADVAGEHDHELRRVPGRGLDALAQPHRLPHEGARSSRSPISASVPASARHWEATTRPGRASGS